MGYFDGLVDGSFKVDVQGRHLFYPYGVLSNGYVLESEQHKSKIRKAIKLMYMIVLPAIIIFQTTVGIWLNLVLLPIYIVWYYFWIKKITKNLQVSNESLKVSDAYQNSAKSHNLVTLIILEVVSLLFVAAGLFILIKNLNMIVGLMTMGLFGLCAVAFGFMIHTKIKK